MVDSIESPGPFPRMRRFAIRLLRVSVLLLLCCPGAARAADRYFTTSDGVRLHYLESGHGRPLVFIPGWTMPAWIFQAQIDQFSRTHRVIVLDPRGQGESDIPRDGYTAARRAQDIGELLQQLGPEPVVLAGWSLGVLDSLAYLQQAGDSRLAGLVLIDNSIGENPPPTPGPRQGAEPKRLGYEQARRRFVEGMFRHTPTAAYIDRLTAASLRTPREAAAALLSYREPRSFWRDAVYSTRKPILYVVTPRLSGQADSLALNDPQAETIVFSDAGHALFADAPERFNLILSGFLRKIGQ